MTALLGALIGVLLAYAAATLRRPKWLRSGVTAFSGVAANFGGIPLAFAFIAALGTQGLMTKILKSGGLDLQDQGFTIYSFWGLVIVYLYFQIPLMVLVTFPAIDGLKPAWREAAANLGATSWGYWRRVGLPVLAPSILGGILLLFANAFSAYATAYALSTGSSNLVTIQIRFFLQGNTITGKGQLGLRAGGVDDHHHGRLHDGLPAAAEEGGAMAASVTRVRPQARPAHVPGRRRRSCCWPARCTSSSRSWPWPASPSSACRWSGWAGRRCSTAGRSTASASRSPTRCSGPRLMLSLKLAVGADRASPSASSCPTALWVHLRVPKARPLVEILTVLPYVVPPIALVVGVAGTFRGPGAVVPELGPVADPLLLPCWPCPSPTAPSTPASGPSTCEPWSTRRAASARGGSRRCSAC